MKRASSQRRRPVSPRHQGESRPQIAEAPTPTIHRAAKPLLTGIGKPDPSPFIPDPFQVEASEKIMHCDVLVAAPTGSGKTWIAVTAIDQYLARGARAWYATPLKALSNSKYEEFGQRYGAERVGILTGDRKENPDAPVVVGTTEILRNQLYDAMHAGRDLDVDLVVLDEAHFLGDPDRGVVWEEVLIYAPSRVRLLLLSATISNAKAIADWLTHIRGSECEVVLSEQRPVPLRVLFHTPEAELTPFLRGSRIFPKAADCAKLERKRGNSAYQPLDMNGIVSTMREFQLLPAIIFLKSRADCDKALQVLRPHPDASDEEDFIEAIKNVTEFYPELRSRPQMDHLITRRAASHHAGQLPAWRLLVEKMMTLGFLDVIFSTSTVAAGVNFPARTVVVTQSDRFDGKSFVDMTATDLHQMTGRAGRRGMDNVGFTLIIPGKFLDAELIKRLVLSSPEPLRSRITINFSMTLNLLLSHSPSEVRELLGRSFAAFHPNPSQARKSQRRLQKEFQKHLNLLEELDYVDEQGAPSYDGRWAAKLRLDHPLLIAELIRHGAFENLAPDLLAALIAPFVIDKDKQVFMSRVTWDLTRPLWKQFRRMIRKLKPLAAFLVDRGFDVPPILFWPAAAAFTWAQDIEWDYLAEHVGADEGDMAMLILRTIDHLRQLVSLKEEKPQLADTAAQAIDMLARSPLI